MKDSAIFKVFVLTSTVALPFHLGCKTEKPKTADEDDYARPNIILIMADDLGYSDLRCFGGEIDTPNLDRLARQGLRFTQFYNATRSCPTRASLLTGLYPHQAGIGHMTEDRGFPSYSGELHASTPTIAEVLKEAGYLTMMTGKWHVTMNIWPEDPDENRPLNRGFDRYFGTLPGHGSFYDPVGLMKGNQFVEPEGDFYYTDAISEYSVKFIREAVEKDEPFFLYVAHLAPHYPLHAREEVIEKYLDTYAEGWDELRKTRYGRLIDKGLIEPSWKLSGRDSMSYSDGGQMVYPWEQDTLKSWQAHRMAVFAAMVDHMDQGTGMIIDELEASGKLENTVIIFLSDNGASSEGHLYRTVERLGTPWKSRFHPDTTRDGRKVKPGVWPGVPLGGPETYGSYGANWANASNTPFRLHKSWVHEGGISTPFIVHWPAGIRVENEIRNQAGHVIDIFPTILELTGANFPDRFNGSKTIPLEGISLVPHFNSNNTEERVLFWEHQGNKAIRKGKWKLVMEYDGEWNRTGPSVGRWELYNMETDRTETQNLADKHPDIVKELEREWNLWSEYAGVVPWDQISNY